MVYDKLSIDHPVVNPWTEIDGHIDNGGNGAVNMAVIADKYCREIRRVEVFGAVYFVTQKEL